MQNMRTQMREETLAPRKHVQMSGSDGSSALAPSMDDFVKFWFESERVLKLFHATDCFLQRQEHAD